LNSVELNWLGIRFVYGVLWTCWWIFWFHILIKLIHLFNKYQLLKEDSGVSLVEPVIWKDVW